MTLTAANCVVGNSGSVMWGTTGITLPTTAVASVASFNDLGYLSEEGVTLSCAPDVIELSVWQARQPVRRTFNGQAISFTGQFAEFNAQSVPRVFGGGALTTGTYAWPLDTATLEEFAGVVDAVDGSDIHRFAFGRANQTEEVSVQFNRQNLAVLPFNFAVLAPSAGGSPMSYYTNSV